MNLELSHEPPSSACSLAGDAAVDTQNHKKSGSGQTSEGWRPARLLSHGLLGGLWLYRHFVSTPLHLLGGPSCGCRFYPTCSDYAAESIRVHGPGAGVFLALRRLLRCTPLHPGGVDFVPPPRALRPRCARTISARDSS